MTNRIDADLDHAVVHRAVKRPLNPDDRHRGPIRRTIRCHNHLRAPDREHRVRPTRHGENGATNQAIKNLFQNGGLVW